MHSGRTQQLLPQPRTHKHISVTISSLHTAASWCVCVCLCVCLWKWKKHCGWDTLSNTPQGSQRAARLHSGTSFSHLHSRCVVLLSHCPNSLWDCFCWGNTILSLQSYCAFSFLCCGCATFSVPSLAFNAAHQYIEYLVSRGWTRGEQT